MNENDEFLLLKAKLSKADQAFELIRKQAADSIQRVLEMSHDPHFAKDVVKETAYFSGSIDAFQILAEALDKDM